ncbi:hypothetical protein [Haloferula sp. BvORR071]|uniref:hypothetical protein n=1 Tax=Haloferula sp. BvORR071 TaxID=1396141 RepID=UPI00054F4515|nr:hypothetical protein [Haloferula sp. BvORR071]
MSAVLNRIRHLPAVFWIGLFPVVVLLWLWADSVRYQYVWDYHRAESWSLHAILDGGQLVVEDKEIVDIKPGHKIEPGFLNYVLGNPTGPTGPVGKIARREIGGSGVIPLHALRLTPVRVDDFGEFKLRMTRHFVSLPRVMARYTPLLLGVTWWSARRRRKRIEAEMPVVEPRSEA